MRIVVIGGTGLIGSKVVERLAERGHEPVSASPSSGVDTVTGEGLARVLEGAAVVVDVTNSPSFEDTAVMSFFQDSTRNILDAEKGAGVHHHVALSVVGTERMAGESGYFRAKLAQERLIEESSVPYSIVHATQFFEFVTRIGDVATVGDAVHLAPVQIQPIAADDVADAVARVSTGTPQGGGIEVAGPDRFRLDELVSRALVASQDPRHVVADPEARYFGARLEEGTLLPGADAARGEIRLEDWVRKTTSSALTS